MQKRSCWLILLFLAIVSLAFAQQSSNLAGTWVGKVQGYGVEMKLVLNADGSADYEGVMGRWRVQGTKLLLTQEGETVGYNFVLQGAQMTLSGGDLMAPMVMTRAGGGAGRAPAPPAQEPEEAFDAPVAPTVQPAPPRGQPARSAAVPASGQRPLSEVEVAKLLEGGVPARRIIALVEERGISFPVNSASVSRLKAKGATNTLIGALQQAEDRGGGQMAEAVPQSGPTQRPASDGLGVAKAGSLASSRGARYRHEKLGVSFVPPPGWKVGERQGLLLMGSDTEAGLIIIRLARRTTLEQLVQDYGEGMQEQGLQLMPTMQAQEFPAGQNRAVAGELAGTAQDGARIRARAVAVASPFGDAAVVMGMTTEEKYSSLKPRVESIAASFQFSQPQAPPVLEAIAGQWFYISSSSFGSSERYLNLCSDGRFSESSNIYSSGSAGTAYGEGGGGTAQWTADGDENQGTITVTYPSGKTSQFQYQRGGGGLYMWGAASMPGTATGRARRRRFIETGRCPESTDRRGWCPRWDEGLDF